MSGVLGNIFMLKKMKRNKPTKNWNHLNPNLDLFHISV